MIDFDKDGIGAAHGNAFFKEFHISHEQVVANQLATVADAFGQLLPAFPVVFAHAILDGVNRVVINQIFQVSYLFVGSTFFTIFAFKDGVVIDTVLKELG